MPPNRDHPAHESANIAIGDVVAYRGRRYVLRGVDPLGVAEPLAILDTVEGRELRVPLAAIHAAANAPAREQT